MAEEEKPRIVSADRFEHFIIIGFSNGTSGRFSADILYSLLQRTEHIFNESSSLDLDNPEPGAL